MIPTCPCSASLLSRLQNSSVGRHDVDPIHTVQLTTNFPARDPRSIRRRQWARTLTRRRAWTSRATCRRASPSSRSSGPTSAPPSSSSPPSGSSPGGAAGSPGPTGCSCAGGRSLASPTCSSRAPSSSPPTSSPRPTPISSTKSGRSTARVTPGTSPGTPPPSPSKGSPLCWKDPRRCSQSMLLHPGSPTAISSSSPCVLASSMDALSTSLPPTWMASTSGPVHSTSGRISLAQTVYGS